MNRDVQALPIQLETVPHRRGDEPNSSNYGFVSEVRSPQAWG